MEGSTPFIGVWKRLLLKRKGDTEDGLNSGPDVKQMEYPSVCLITELQDTGIQKKLAQESLTETHLEGDRKEMDNNSVWVIYKDGKRLNRDAKGVKVHVAYLRQSGARTVVTTLVHNYLRWELDISETYDYERWKKEEAKERARYEIIEFVPKGQ